MIEPVVIRRATMEDAGAVAEIHLRSRRKAMPWLAVVHTDEETRWWVEHVMLVNDEVWIADSGGAVIGYVAVAPGWLEHLYIRPGSQGRGIGRRLLDCAKERQLGEIQLWAFARNTRARRFYEAAGFTLVEETDGASNEEHEPDVRYRWRP